MAAPASRLVAGVPDDRGRSLVSRPIPKVVPRGAVTEYTRGDRHNIRPCIPSAKNCLVSTLVGWRARYGLIVAFGILNAITYSALLPLWEGFDEPFHFAYVQHLGTEQRLPQLGTTTLSAEVLQALQLAPASHVVRSNIPTLMTYDAFYRLPQHQQEDRLQHLDPQLRHQPSDFYNYEAHQAPLAYMILAPLETALQRVSITDRVLALRLFAGTVSVALTAASALWLASELGLYGIWVSALLLCTFSHQMFYATVAHVANDWLSVPTFVAWNAALCRYVRTGTPLSAATAGLLTSIGLLSKAYFLAVLPVLFLIFVWRVVRDRRYSSFIAGLVSLGVSIPWYCRNVLLYNNVSGTVEAANGIGVSAVIANLLEVPWLSSIAYMARASVWTGNNSFNTFSETTINMHLALLGIMFVMYFRYRLGKTAWGRDAVVLGSTVVFMAALAYATVASYIFTNGRSAGASPWYMQPLLVPLLTLSLIGASSSGKLGKTLAAGFTALNVYILFVSYSAKLFPAYNGYLEGKVTIASILTWYMEVFSRDAVSLSLASSSFVGAMIGVTTVLAIYLCVQVCLPLMRSQ